MLIYNFRSSENNYTQVTNSLIDSPLNSDMSPESTWLVLYLLRQKSGKFNIYRETLMNKLKCGKERLNRMIQEAKAAKYLYNARAKDKNTGQYVKGFDGWFVSDVPEIDKTKLEIIINIDAPENIYLTIEN